MRLTLELIAEAPQLLSPSKERTLVLRGYKISLIENMGATQDDFECIDFTDNDIIKLSNFPPLPRLRTLIIANNRVSRIADDIADYLPNARSIVLTSNRLEMLGDLLPLFKLKKLERLSLVDNAVCTAQHFRLLVIYKIPSLRFLNFQRILQRERNDAKLLFDGDEGLKLIQKIAAPRRQASSASPSATPSSPNDKNPTPTGSILTAADASALSPQQILKIKEAIINAKTIEEVTRLERALKTGTISDDLFGTRTPSSPPTTASSPPTTASSPQTTTSSPQTTTSSPQTTTSSPQTTAPSPQTTAPSPPATTSSPQTTTSSPPTTASSPPTTASSPPTTASSPPTTASSPPTTASSPPTTAPSPQTTASSPQTPSSPPS